MKTGPYNLIKIMAVFFLAICFLNIPNYINAGNLTASNYEINFCLEYPQKIQSEVINIERIDDEDFFNQEIYIEKFKLKSEDDKEIAAADIVVETPYYKADLESTYRFLLMDKDQSKSWFKIELLPDAAKVKPGKYTGVVKIDGLEWQMEVEVEVRPFITFALDNNELKFKIDDPTKSNFYVSPELCKLNISTNHQYWEIQVSLSEGKLTAGEGLVLQQKQIFYRLEDPSSEKQYTTINNPEEDDFIRMEEAGSSLLLNGNNYSKGLTAVRFGVNLGEEWTQQPAGEYTGIVIFTLRQLFDEEVNGG